MTSSRFARATILAAAAAISLSACSYSAMGPSEQSVLENDPFLPGGDHNLTGCIGPANTQGTTFAKVHKFPARQIVWNATYDPNHDVDPYVAITSTKALAQMAVPVSVTFDLTTNCDALKKFYTRYASGYGGVLNDDGTESQGWRNLLNHVIGQPLQDTINRVVVQYPWQQVYSDQAVLNELRTELDKDLPAATAARTDGDTYFSHFQVTVLKPQPVDANLKAAIDNQQTQVQQAQASQAAGIAQAQADQAKADAEVAAAEAQAKAEAQKALALQAKIHGFGDVDAYLRSLAIEKGINPWQPQLVPQPVQGR
jgi:regulator of protease activity HflC (stomatin/prohibitin superfamily)